MVLKTKKAVEQVFLCDDLRRLIMDMRYDMMHQNVSKRMCKSIYIPWLIQGNTRLLMPVIPTKRFPLWKLTPNIIYDGDDDEVHIVYKHEVINECALV